MSAEVPVLSDADVTRLVTPAAAAAAVRSACADLAADAFEVPRRLVLDDGRLLVMTARHRPTATAVTKIVSLRDAVSGLVTWTAADGSTRALAPAAQLTALRTAAATAVAVDEMADAQASRLVLFGTGVQARAHAVALHGVRPLTELVLVGRDPRRAEQCRRALDHALAGVSVSVASDPRAALAKAHLVCCTTTATEPLFALDDLPAGVHVSAVGSHRADAAELPTDLLAAATEVVVDDVAACLEEAGEIVTAIARRAVQPESIVGLPARLGGGRAEGRSVYKSVGTAAYDWALAAVLASSAPTLTLAAG